MRENNIWLLRAVYSSPQLSHFRTTIGLSATNVGRFSTADRRSLCSIPALQSLAGPTNGANIDHDQKKQWSRVSVYLNCFRDISTEEITLSTTYCHILSFALPYSFLLFNIFFFPSCLFSSYCIFTVCARIDVCSIFYNNIEITELFFFP